MKTIQEVLDDINPDLFVDMINNDPEHIRRSKEKAERMRQAATRPQKQRHRKTIDKVEFMAAVVTAGTIIQVAIQFF